MTSVGPPCPLCEEPAAAVAGFHQWYPQAEAEPIRLDWQECPACKALFVHPIPSPGTIARYWGTVEYADGAKRAQVAEAKRPLLERVLRELNARTSQGPLLDIGSNFGHFLVMARDQGWDAQGYEPNDAAAAESRRIGFTVHGGWNLESCGLTPDSLAAIVAVDVFCYSWHPVRDLRAYHRLLRPGGVLAMRLTNKRFVLGIARALSRGERRDRWMSRLLQAQFHSVSMPSLSRVLQAVGYDQIEVIPGALTSPFESLSFTGRCTYRLSGWLCALSARRINLSPGVLLLAQKAGP